VTQLVLGQVLNGAIIGAMYASSLRHHADVRHHRHRELRPRRVHDDRRPTSYTLAERGMPYGAVVPVCLIAAAAGYLQQAFFRFTCNNRQRPAGLTAYPIFESASMFSDGHAGRVHFRAAGRVARGDVDYPR
jgi:hypothetical protein